jgi:hypothetical protein
VTCGQSQNHHTLLPAQTDLPGISVVAARRADGSLTILLINLLDTAVDAPLQIVGQTMPETAERHLFDPDHAAEPVGTISFGDN